MDVHRKNEHKKETKMPDSVKEFAWWAGLKKEYFRGIAPFADGYARAASAPDVGQLKKVRIFDTTGRDGMQTPDAFLTEERSIPVKQNKIDVAVELAKWGVPLIEVGFAVSNHDEIEAIREAKRRIAELGLGSKVVSLARMDKRDIDAVVESEADIIHLFSSGSIPHAWVKFGKSPKELIPGIIESVKYARNAGFSEMVVSLEDAVRTRPSHLLELAERLQEIGKGEIHYNIPDTVGVCDPAYMFALISYLRQKTGIPLQVHCHNDMGRAVENTLAAIYAGVSEFHATVHGMGERTGNASMEQVLINLYANHGVELVDMRRLDAVSRFISERAGLKPAFNAPVVGAKAFWHESGVHADAVYKSGIAGYMERIGVDGGSVYAAYNARIIGRVEEVGIGPLCGQKNVMYRLAELGIAVDDAQLQQIVAEVKSASVKSKVSGADFIHMVYAAVTGKQCAKFMIEDCRVETGIDHFEQQKPEAWVKLKLNGHHPPAAHGRGNGAVDAAVNAIDEALGEWGITISSYELKAIGEGSDSKGRVTLTVRKDGTGIESSAVGTDIVIVTLEAFRKGFDALEALRELRAAGPPPALDGPA